MVPAEQQVFIKKLGKVLHIGINLAAAAYAGLATGTLAGIAGVVALLPGAGILGSILVGVFAEKVLKTSGATTMGAIILGGLLGIIGAGAAGYLVGYHGASVVAAVAMMAASAVTMLLENIFSPHKGEAKKDGALVAEVGIGAAVLVAAGAIFSPSFASSASASRRPRRRRSWPSAS
ncbi:MAG: hypothetical protein FD126_3569 [Elusimicrobia bacterium]|nr:MAG: hypothetical protein FD126_3569 [Elusimicrobiota bacterium]